jgi:hypothetical protein
MMSWKDIIEEMNEEVLQIRQKIKSGAAVSEDENLYKAVFNLTPDRKAALLLGLWLLLDAIGSDNPYLARAVTLAMRMREDIEQGFKSRTHFDAITILLHAIDEPEMNFDEIQALSGKDLIEV